MWRNDQQSLPAFMAVCRALADEQRVRILRALQPGEVCVCQIVELLDLAPSTVSKHLAILRDAGLIRARKEGRWMHYRLTDDTDGAPEFILRGLAWVHESLSRGRALDDDTRRLKAILKIDPEQLCCIQRAGGQAVPTTRSSCCP